MPDPAIRSTFTAVMAKGNEAPRERDIALETPIAIEINGLGYAVMMATPNDLVDFATGFIFTERLIDRRGDLVDLSVHEQPNGLLLRATVSAHCAGRVAERVRHRVSESSCGLCGIENLEQALRPLPVKPAAPLPDPPAVFAALAALPALQPLSNLTGAVHGAAFCDASGNIHMVREDVGRHNAFDKLIGAILRADVRWDDGFALLTSRCSYELVEKAALAGCPTLVTISAATSLAMARACEAGVNLLTLARADCYLVSPSDRRQT